MSSLVERLRVRSDRKPVYNIDDSDDDADIVDGKLKNAQKFEKIVRTDAVCCSINYFALFNFLLLLYFCCSWSQHPLIIADFCWD